LVPSDATVLKRLGDLYEEEGDYQSAYHYYYDVGHSLFTISQPIITITM